MIEIHLIRRGDKPEYRKALRASTFDTWIRGRDVDMIVVFGANSEEQRKLIPVLIPAVMARHGRVEWMSNSKLIIGEEITPEFTDCRIICGPKFSEQFKKLNLISWILKRGEIIDSIEILERVIEKKDLMISLKY
jgi:hypothetical protein